MKVYSNGAASVVPHDVSTHVSRSLVLRLSLLILLACATCCAPRPSNGVNGVLDRLPADERVALCELLDTIDDALVTVYYGPARRTLHVVVREHDGAEIVATDYSWRGPYESRAGLRFEVSEYYRVRGEHRARMLHELGRQVASMAPPSVVLSWGVSSNPTWLAHISVRDQAALFLPTPWDERDAYWVANFVRFVDEWHDRTDLDAASDDELRSALFLSEWSILVLGQQRPLEEGILDPWPGVQFNIAVSLFDLEQEFVNTHGRRRRIVGPDGEHRQGPP